MTFDYRTFPVEVTREIDPKLLSWPKRGEAQDDYGLGGNRLYTDLRGFSWHEALQFDKIEAAYITRIEELSSFETEPFTDYELYAIAYLDIGVATVVATLSAAKCIPFNSYNAGAFGDNHSANYPFVAFYAREETINILLECADTSDVGLENVQVMDKDDGPILVYADDIRKMRTFADTMIKRRRDFQKLRSPRRKPSQAQHPSQTMLL